MAIIVIRNRCCYDEPTKRQRSSGSSSSSNTKNATIKPHSCYCENGGTCVVELTRAACLCAPNFIGPACEDTGNNIS